MRKKYVKCGACGKTDSARYAGTAKTMVCPDCNDGKTFNKYGRPLACKCRDCCPTGHATRWQ